jgi:hypothetical protein
MKTDVEPTYSGRLWPESPLAHDGGAPQPAPRASKARRVLVGFVIAVLLAVGIGALGYQQARNQHGLRESAGRPSPTTESAPNRRPKAVRHLSSRSEDWVVQLTWDVPQGTEIDHYVVKRGGTMIASPSSPSYEDDDVVPGSSYSYSVVAVSPAGRKSVPERVTAHVPTVPQSEATLSGTYAFQMHAVSQHGYKDSYRGTFWIDVIFEPTIEHTRVSFQLLDTPSIRGRMYSKGDGRFHGTAAGDWGTTCGQRASISHFVWDVRIEHASPDNAEDLLVADRVSATLEVSEPAQSGCRAAGVTFQGTAT